MPTKKILLFASSTLVLVFVFLGSAQADDWPQLSGPGRDGVWPQPIFAGERPAALMARERWRLPLGSGYSGVVVAGGRLYTMTSDGERDLAIALDPASGAELWRTVLDAAYPGDIGSVPGPISTPAVAHATVFTVTPRGHLVALRAEDGKVRWRRDLAAELGAVEPNYGIAASPLVDGSRVVVMVGGEETYLAAFDATSGELVWGEGHGSGSSYASPVKATLHGIEQILVMSGQALYGVDSADGSLLWSYPLTGQGMIDRMPLVLPDDRLFLPLMGTGGLMLAVRSGSAADAGEDGRQVELRAEELWQTPRLAKSTHSPPLYHDGHLYGMNGSLLVCISADDGTLRWRTRLYDGTLILVDGFLLVMSAGSGKFHVVKASPDAYEEVFVTPLVEIGHHTVTPPSYADRTVFVRNVRELVALDLLPSVSSPLIPPKGTVSPPPGGDPSAAPAVATAASDDDWHVLWRLPLAEGIEPGGEAGLTADGDRVFTLAADAETEYALAVDVTSGKELWRTALDPRVDAADVGPVSTPAAASGRLLTLSSACRLRALAGATGNVLWQRDLQEDFKAVSRDQGCRTSPLTVDSLVVVQAAGEKEHRVVALRQDDGSLVWSSEGLAQGVETSPRSAVFDGVPQVLVHAQKEGPERTLSLLYSLRPTNGEVLWSFQAEKFFSTFPPVVAGEHVMLSTWAHSYLLRPPAKSAGAGSEVPRASERWRGETLDSTVYRDGHLYAYIGDEMVAIDVTSGEIRWRENNTFGSIASGGDRLAVISYRTGLLRIVDASPDAYRERARLGVLNAGAVNYVAPSFVNGKVIVRNQEEMVAVAERRHP